VDDTWETVAQRAVGGLGVDAGELVLVHDGAGRPDVLSEVRLAVEQRGATPLLELAPPDYLRRLLQTVPVPHLAAWDRHRLSWVRQADRVLFLEGAELDTEGVPAEALAAWGNATDRLGAVDEERRLPYLLLAVPTAPRAAALGLALPELDAALVPALAADTAELRREIARVRAVVEGARALTVRSGAGCELHLALGDRPWLDDDGVLTPEDRARGAQVVINLPTGAVYTTVLEQEARGRLHLPGTGGVEGATLTFEGGCVVEVAGSAEAEAVRALFDRHAGDARRVGHVGVGLNPRLRRPLGWTLVDIHAHGCLLVSFGENRYLGGENASSLNVDFAIPGATLLADGRVVVEAGAVAV
jgi:leucyl aminopeptidase (aminopeptidase T)